MLIVNLEPENFSQYSKEKLKELGSYLELDPSSNEFFSLKGQVDILIVRLGFMLDERFLDEFESLKVIVSATTGLNHIDLSAAEKKCIDVISLKGETEFLRTVTATAELTWGLLVAVSRNLISAAEDVTEGRWCRDAFKGTQLAGKTIGIIGYGRLGSIIAEYAKAFRMRVIVNDVRDDVESIPLELLLKDSDVVTVHVDYNVSNECMFSDAEFSMMKDTAVFLNTSRGELVDEEALERAIVNHEIAGAAIDVLSGEASLTCYSDNRLIQLAAATDRLIVTPHIGGATFESMANAEDFVVDKLINHISQPS
ncbi:NAD(P)-dependent oxidoreductase [Aliamphritea ceti]|uniref:NAD(P)-dependent oxidoreductase n=1 Tax=Aliamphritea ceti TaxID=1524258 RepID=UPI0021C40806|nr:NAD(P)-dependent oxidoreductase [Aliamphritea ceti]